MIFYFLNWDILEKKKINDVITFQFPHHLFNRFSLLLLTWKKAWVTGLWVPPAQGSVISCCSITQILPYSQVHLQQMVRLLGSRIITIKCLVFHCGWGTVESLQFMELSVHVYMRDHSGFSKHFIYHWGGS